MEIPVIDIFAGPGGLGEGFSAYMSPGDKKRKFKITLSVEKDTFAHQTLTLRSFFRQFPPRQIPDDYFDFVKGKISLDELYNRWPEQAKNANEEAWKATLGDDKNSTPNSDVDEKIRKALNGNKNWLLIGGPPCQAYSVVGRSRRKEKILDEKKDERVGLYKQYLRILAVHSPKVFVMENVKGLLSAKTEHSPVFSKILKDLSDPKNAYLSEYGSNGVELKCPGYRIYSLVTKPTSFDQQNNPVYSHKDFVIQSENYGVPQTRHRVILLGVRKDIKYQPAILKTNMNVPISSVLTGLPKLRSTLSKSEDSGENWIAAIRKITTNGMLSGVDKNVRAEIIKQINNVSQSYISGGEYMKYKDINSKYRPDWYIDNNLEGVCNHTSRGHMESDLLRYFFASCFARVKKRSPKLEDFPASLLPAHKNVKAGIENKKFADRFRVQLWDTPSKTITSHISKDGHYYIHPDPIQCRSLTVREAARIQTFPDNYFFCGPRTSQFIQVGNAVPPLLANQIAGIVYPVFATIIEMSKKRHKISEAVKVKS